MTSNVKLVSGVWHRDSVIHIYVWVDTHTHTYTHTHIYILFQIVFPYRLSHNIEYSYLCDTVSPLGYLFYIQYCVYVNSSLINEKHEDLVAYFHDSSSISGDTNV